MLAMKAFANMHKTKALNAFPKRFFSHGPYNPMNYKRKLVSDKKLTYIYFAYLNIKHFIKHRRNLFCF